MNALIGCVDPVAGDVPPPLRPSSSRKPENYPGCKKPCQPPEMRKLNSEQAKLILLARAWEGDLEASRFLRHLFPVSVGKVSNSNWISDVESGRDRAS